MQKILLDYKTCQLKIFNGENTDTQNYIFSGSIEEVLNYKISELLRTLIKGNYCSSNYTQTYGNTIFVSHVFKSKSKKSVYQKSAFSNHKFLEIYLLPEKYRDKNFRSVIAIKDGPFNYRKVDNVLQSCKPFYLFKTFFVGTTYECMEYFTEMIISLEFANFNFATLPSNFEEKKAFEDSIEKIGKAIESNHLKEKIKKFYEQNHEDIICEFIYDNTNNDSDYSWVDLGEEELDSLDRETNGEWRLNID